MSCSTLVWHGAQLNQRPRERSSTSAPLICCLPSPRGEMCVCVWVCETLSSVAPLSRSKNLTKTRVRFVRLMRPTAVGQKPRPTPAPAPVPASVPAPVLAFCRQLHERKANTARCCMRAGEGGRGGMRHRADAAIFELKSIRHQSTLMALCSTRGGRGSGGHLPNVGDAPRAARPDIFLLC